MNEMKYSKIKGLAGWLSRTDFEIIRSVLKSQDKYGISGSIVEIGVHHGKSFVPLSIYSGSSKLYAIDIFGDQELNIDQSGAGDLIKFQNNIKKYGVQSARIHIDCRMSSSVLPDEIIEKVGMVRLFHIDGGHHLDAISYDLALACATLEAGGVIVVDDVFRPEWPEVTAGVFQSELMLGLGYAIFAVGFNKVYICDKKYIDQYQNALRLDPIIENFLHRVYKSPSGICLVYQRYPLPEWNFITFLSYFMELKFPNIYLWARKARRSAASAAARS